MRLDPTMINQQIANLILQYPELQDDEQLRADMIEGETEALKFLRDMEMKRQDTTTLIAGISQTMTVLGLRLRRFENRELAFRKLIFNVMQAADLKKLELAEATLSIRAGVQKVIITDENQIPSAYCRIKREPDKTAIKKCWEEGVPVSGTELSNAEPILSIRTK